MFAFIRGILAEANPIYCVLDAGGIGYKLFIPASVLSKLSPIGQEQLLYCSFVVREQSQALYGFITATDRDLFELLMGVTGIGPKLALSIIGHLPLVELQRAISSNDIHTLSKIPGIGKKTSERLIIEIRDKLGTLYSSIDPNDLALNVKVDLRSQVVMDAMSALIHLGYTQSIAQKAIKKTMSDLPENSELPVIITHALKNV